MTDRDYMDYLEDMITSIVLKGCVEVKVKRVKLHPYMCHSKFLH
ncbi:MAG: hypothetical protein ACD_79C00228G0003 [uncultured bacterium]|nr:MAG: hypothetical protein ACD_79C00228G0003 [uncultured bacterium]